MMNQEQTKELLSLLALFAHENGRENLEALKTVQNMAANAYITTQPSDNPKEQACRAFNSGDFNDIAYAYLILACKRAGLDDNTGAALLETMGHLFDEIPAEEAMKMAKANR